MIVPAGPIGPKGGLGFTAVGGGASDGVDVQLRDRGPSDLARRAANVSELISASPAEYPAHCLALWNQVVGRGVGANPGNMSFMFPETKKKNTVVKAKRKIQLF